jgi:type IV pilus assembly protein PilE
MGGGVGRTNDPNAANRLDGRCYYRGRDQGSSKMRRHIARGFTLIELMVVVAIIAIIAAIAIPSYSAQVRKSRRADAVNGLGDLQLRQERWRAENPSYATTAQLGAMPSSSYYTFSTATSTGNCATTGTPACTASTCYTLTADTTGSQTADDGSCATMSISSKCGIVTKASTPAGSTCWSQ